jgi:hypothetical protein
MQNRFVQVGLDGAIVGDFWKYVLSKDGKRSSADMPMFNMSCDMVRMHFGNGSCVDLDKTRRNQNDIKVQFKTIVNTGCTCASDSLRALERGDEFCARANRSRQERSV